MRDTSLGPVRVDLTLEDRQGRCHGEMLIPRAEWNRMTPATRKARLDELTAAALLEIATATWSISDTTDYCAVQL